MNDFISWLKADDVTFRAYYLSKTGEKIQSVPTDADTHWQIGSSRLNSIDLIELQSFIGITVDATPTTYKSPTQLAAEAESLASIGGA